MAGDDRTGDRQNADLLTPAQAAAILGVSTASVRLWATDGRLAYTTTPGGHRRFERRAVVDLIIEGRGPAGRAARVTGDSGDPARERVWVRAISAAMRAAAADLGEATPAGARFADEADRLEASLLRFARD